ncbi:MAG: gamma-glutamyl-gamma-aminobutyrate hydrolase family protein [Patescibacteria group bacterium]
MELPKFVITDLRSQLTKNIEREFREEGYRSAILDPSKTKDWLRSSNKTDAIILSGGDWSVYAKGSPQPPKEVWTAKRPDGSLLPKLGICYGHHVLAWKHGGSVEARNAEYGKTIIELVEPDFPLFRGTEPEQQVWMNHGDSVTKLPEGWRILARTRATGNIAAFCDPTGTQIGVQWHPESTHSVNGRRMLANFAAEFGHSKDWNPGSMVSSIRDELRERFPSGNAIMPFSGGVDSSFVAYLAAGVLGLRLFGMTIDADNLRRYDLGDAKKHAHITGLQHVVINAHDKVGLFACTTDAETKRKAIFRNQIYVPPIVRLKDEKDARFWLQGTLAPDLIESGETGGAVIKSHHNTGINLGIPEYSPLKDLFKYEVRALAKAEGLPESIWNRMPFPGPGLFLRVVGIPVTHELLECVRDSNDIVEAILRRTPEVWDEISQLVVAYLGTPMVGQKGEGRVYRGSIGVRAVKTIDYMTAEGIYFPKDVWKEIERELTKHPLVVHAAPYSTDKPPATTEFE